MEKKKPNWTLIHESKSPLVDKLFEAYKKDKHKARILYFNNLNNIFVKRVVIFFHDNGDFEVCNFEQKIGISISNKMYRREKKIMSIVNKGGKFWFIDNRRTNKCIQLTYDCLRTFVLNFVGYSDEVDNNQLITFFLEKFSWMRFIAEEKSLHGVSFNTIVKNKLYSQKDALRYKFKVPYPVIKVLKEYFKEYNNSDMFKIWKEMRQVLINVENLKLSLMSHHAFKDTCMMARTLGYKVNCSWSVKRLTIMHDKWSKEIANTVLEFEDYRELNVGEIYRDFANISGYKLLTSNHDLLYEGMTQKHCVTTYVSKVHRGNCGIYHINGYTLELIFDCSFLYQKGLDVKKTLNKYLKNVQFRGVRNCNAPVELSAEVEIKILAFNKELAKKYGTESDIEILDKIYLNNKNNTNSFLNDDLQLNNDLNQILLYYDIDLY